MNMNEDNPQEPQPPDSQNEEPSQKNAADAVEGASADSQDKGLHYEPGILVVEFEEGVNPQFIPALNGIGLRIAGQGNVELFNKALEELPPLLKVEPTFPTAHKQMVEFDSDAAQEELGPNLRNFFTLYFNPEKDARSLASNLRQLSGLVRAASVIPKTRPASSPTHELLVGTSDQIVTVGRDGLENQWYLFRCGVNRAWNLASGKGVVIADIDYGYLISHVELAGRLNLERRYNSYDDTDNVAQGDDTRHGTAVMGLVGAAINSTGMAGIAYDAELWPIQANTGEKKVTDTPWAAAIDWVRNVPSEKRKVILIEAQTDLLHNIEMVDISVRVAIEKAIAYGIVVCVAAGNGDYDASLNDENEPMKPTGSILVGATMDFQGKNLRLQLANGEASNWGESIVVSAPGDRFHDVTCDIRHDKDYSNKFGGTSGAAAKIAGAVALMLEANPYIRPSDVREILNRTGTHIETADDRPVGRFLNCEAAVRAARCAPAWGTRWLKLSGTAIDITDAPDGKVWHLGTNHTLYRLNKDCNSWSEHSVVESAVKIAVGAQGNPWYINAAGDIYRALGSEWQQLPGKALDIAIGANGSVWRIGPDNLMYRWYNNQWLADVIPGYAIKIAVGPDGRPWRVNCEGDIYRRVGDAWQQVPGKALELSIGADGSVWSIGLNEISNGNAMYRWSGSTWEIIEGAATSIAVGSNGLPWRVNRSGDIFRRT